MKILSSFDTRLYDQLKQDYINQYGAEHVMFITRASIFFWIYIMLPLFIMIIILVLMVVLAFGLNIKDIFLQTIIQIMVLISGLTMLFIWGSKIIKRYIDYTMDFCIITPKELVSYNQSGFFDRHTEIIDTEKVKTINKISQGFFGSIFNFANIVFLSEGDMETGDISLNFVENPEEVYKQVRLIIEPHLNQKAMQQFVTKQQNQ